MSVAEMAKLVCPIGEKFTDDFIKDWRPFMDYITKLEKNSLMIMGL